MSRNAIFVLMLAAVLISAVDTKTRRQVLYPHQQPITNDMISSAKSAMSTRGFKSQLQRLSTDDAFLRHLVLHEVASFVLGTAEQEPRDRWAFQELHHSG